jgi:hypothetical protein
MRTSVVAAGVPAVLSGVSSIAPLTSASRCRRGWEASNVSPLLPTTVHASSTKAAGLTAVRENLPPMPSRSSRRSRGICLWPHPARVLTRCAHAP